MGIVGLENKMATMDAPAAPETPSKPERIPEGAPPRREPKVEPQEPKEGEIPTGKIPGQGGDGIPTPDSDVKDALKQAAEKFEFDFTVDGQTVKKEFTRDQLKAQIQKSLAADKRLNDYARMQQREQQLLWLAQNRPDVFMTQFGIDPDQWAHDRILKRIERENMTPEQRKALENEERLRQIEEENKRLKYEHEQRMIQERVNIAKENYTREINTALSDAKLPNNMWTQKRVIHYLQEAYGKMGIKLPAKDVIPLVKEDYINEQRSLLSNMDPDAIVETVGDDVRRKLREFELKLVQQKEMERQQKGRDYKPRAATPKQDGPKLRTMDDFRRHNAEIKGEKY